MKKWSKWRNNAAAILRSHRRFIQRVQSAEWKMQCMETDYPDHYVKRVIARGTGLDFHCGETDIPQGMIKAKRTELIIRRIAREHQKCA